MSKAMTTEQLNKIQPILSEIINTENTFIKSLQEFEFFLKSKLITLSGSGVMVKNFLEGLIISINSLSLPIEIYNDKALLIKVDEKRIDEKDIHSFINLLTKSFSEPKGEDEGEFLKKIPILMLYTTYFDQNQKMLTALFKDDPETGVNDRTWVNDRFILPIQRLPRYQLFLKEIRKQVFNPFEFQEIIPENIQFLLDKLDLLFITVSTKLSLINNSVKLLDSDTVGMLSINKSEFKKNPPPVPTSYQALRGTPIVVKTAKEKSTAAATIPLPPPIPASSLRKNSVVVMKPAPSVSKTPEMVHSKTSNFLKTKAMFETPAMFSEPRQLVKLPTSKSEKDTSTADPLAL